ncbi:hypothetical protein BDW22DRAFT_1349944 [Trametopsis cervina]|nr:hypothetical protein BDW22DRAFT_1349944 [Trametopsis cervina]
MSSRSVKQLEKLLNQESSSDQRNIQNAEKQLHAAEKKLQKSIKETAKAQLAVEKAAKNETKTAKVLHKSEAALKGATADREKAEQKLGDKSQRADLEQQDIQQRFGQLDEAITTFDEKERERSQQVHEMQATQEGDGTHSSSM